MAENKTKATNKSVTKFLNGIADVQRRADCFALLELMQKATRAEPKMWGSAIVGVGDYHYKYESGRENDWFTIGFSPRKQNLTLYSMGGFTQFEELLSKLGKHKLGKGCLYINKLDEVNVPTLKKLIGESVKEAKKRAKEQS